MDYNANMEKIFQKLGDLKSFFIYGQKIVPVMQKIVDFMQDTVPLLENVNQSIQDSTSKIPKAAMQINNITSATEVATTEILDIVDAISSDVQTIKTKLEIFRNKIDKQKDIISRLLLTVNENKIACEIINNELIPEFVADELVPMVELIEKIHDGVMNITISLQVQDITAQQLSSVNHLIHAVQEKLSSLVTDLNNKEVKEVPIISYQVAESGSFNPDARYNKDKDSQSLADSLVNSQGKKSSQEEIDKLFSMP
jgi:chemotaxis regulatin CheY-phosphate phosphatase CheZ